MALKLSTGLRNAMLDTGSFQDTLANGIIYVYTGSQPSDPDTAPVSTNILKITVASGSFTHGVTTNGLNFGTAAAGVIAKATAEVWSGVGINGGGTAGWFRFCANGTDSEPSDADTTRKSFDGAIASSGAELNMASTTITTGATTTIDSFSVTLPAS